MVWMRCCCKRGYGPTGHRNVTCVEGIASCVDHLTKILTPGDLLLTLGAGDVYRVGELMLEQL